MRDYFEDLRIPHQFLAFRNDPEWEGQEQDRERQQEVLQALLDAVHDALVTRALQRRENGMDSDEDPEFIKEVWAPIWDGLRASLSRQDLMRLWMDHACEMVRERAQGTVVRMAEELSMLDDASGAWWLTENPG